MFSGFQGLVRRDEGIFQQDGWIAVATGEIILFRIAHAPDVISGFAFDSIYFLTGRENAVRATKTLSDRRSTITAQLSSLLIGQPSAMSAVVDSVMLFESGLAPEYRPCGVFLLMGPTGTGKTHTVESLAKVLHGSPKSVLRIDCGEYQMEHEVAKLIGAPPGYLGHRETQPALTQQKLTAAASSACGISLVLFDEIEKAAPSMVRILLGVLDKGTLRLGDNTSVSFERTIVFMTSNLGADAMQAHIRRCMDLTLDASPEDLAAIGDSALRKAFSPEFINRIDLSVVYLPLSEESVRKILDLQILDLERRISSRCVSQFTLTISQSARDFLVRSGYSLTYGARELKRAINQFVMRPLADLVVAGIDAGSAVAVSAKGDSISVVVKAKKTETAHA